MRKCSDCGGRLHAAFGFCSGDTVIQALSGRPVTDIIERCEWCAWQFSKFGQGVSYMWGGDVALTLMAPRKAMCERKMAASGK